MAGVARFEGQARFQPLKFLQAIAEEVEIYEQTRVLKVEGQRVETARGAVTAEHIIFVSHYPFINVPGYYFARMYQERSSLGAAATGAGLTVREDSMKCFWIWPGYSIQAAVRQGAGQPRTV